MRRVFLRVFYGRFWPPTCQGGESAGGANSAKRRRSIRPAMGRSNAAVRLARRAGRLVTLDQAHPRGRRRNLPSWSLVPLLPRQHQCAGAGAQGHRRRRRSDRSRSCPTSGKSGRTRSNATLPFPILTDIDNGYALSLNLTIWIGEEIRTMLQGRQKFQPFRQRPWMLRSPQLSWSVATGSSGRASWIPIIENRWRSPTCSRCSGADISSRNATSRRRAAS